MACPCKQKLTDQQKELINSQSGKSFVQNPNADRALGIGNSLSQTLGRLSAIATAVQTPTAGTIGGALQQTGVDTVRLQSVINNTNNLATAVTAFKNQAQSIGSKEGLMRTIGRMNFYANLGCALGIEGLDVSVSIGVLTGNGTTALNLAGNVNLDLDRILENFSRNPAGEGLANSAREFNTALERINSKINEASAAVGKVTQDSINMLEQARIATTEFGFVNFFNSLIGESNDPCNKMAFAVNDAGLISPQFQQLSQAANASLASPFTNSGSTTTR